MEALRVVQAEEAGEGGEALAREVREQTEVEGLEVLEGADVLEGGAEGLAVLVDEGERGLRRTGAAHGSAMTARARVERIRYRIP